MPPPQTESAQPMRYSVHRWAPTQPTPTLDYVLWLRETLPPEDLFALAEALTELGHQAEEHHQTRVEVGYVVEEVMRHLHHPPVASANRSTPEEGEA